MTKNNNMMKKIFLLVLFLVLGKMWGYAQYPIQQFLGADSALVTSKGGLQGRLINWTYSDTAQANNQRIKAYPGAQIATINGGLNLWIRNATATAWIPVAIGSGNNIYTIDGTLLGNRELDGAGYDLRFNSLKEFGVGSDSIVFNSPKQRYFAGNQSFILQGDTASLSRRLSYTGNIGSTFTKYSLIDKNYVDSAIASSPAGTVTSIATNNATGITGGTITSTGTLAIDTTIISTKANVSGGLAGKLNISDTATMLQNYVNNVGYGLGKTSQSVYADSATLSAYYLRRKDSLTATNSLGYVTKTILADTAAAIRGASVSGFVPYVGATQNVNLGQFGLKTEYAEFDTTLRAVTSRTLQWSNADGTLQFGMTNGGTITQNIGLQQFARVRNLQGSQITKGQVVYISGASGDRASVKLADNRDDSTSSKTLGVAAENIANGDVGFVGTFGTITNLNLSAFNPGDIVYLDSVPGQLTNVKPQAPYNMVFIGVVERANSGNGLLFVNPQNGYELEELHNVKITKPVRNNAILVYDSTKKVWVDTTISQAGLAVTSVATNAGTGITGGTITTSGTLAIDTLRISTRAWRQKGVDSLQANINLKLNISDTAAMLSPYLRKVDTTAMLQNYVNNVGYGLDKSGQVVSVDTLEISTRAWRQKGIDSVAALINSNVSGTTNYVSKFTGTNTIGNSQIFDNGTNVGVGTTSPTQKLDVNGDASFNGVRVGRGAGNSIVNTVVGNNSMTNVTSGTDNTAVGFGALAALTSGGKNTSMGISALTANTSGSLNTAIGESALNSNTSGGNNIGIGSESMKFNTTGGFNVGVGNGAIAYNTSGTYNTSLGYDAGKSPVNAGQFNQTGTYNLYLGSLTRAAGNGNNTNEIVIGAQADGNGSNSVTLGNGSITKTILRANVGVGTTAPDSALTVVNGAYFQRGVRMSGLPSAPGTKALRINANGTLSIADTLVDAGGTVTSVATNTGTGIIGGTITTSGTLAIDTLLISTRAWRQKGIDSVAALLPAAISGTTNYITKFTGANSLGNSNLYESSGNIGLGTTSPVSYSGYNVLTIAGSTNGGVLAIRNPSGFGLNLSATGNAATIDAIDNTAPMVFTTNSSERMRITSSGNVGIGTSSPAYKLDVSGTGRFGNTSNNTDGINLLDANSTKTHIGSGFGATFIQNNVYYNGSAYAYDNNTLPSSVITLSSGEFNVQTGAANTSPTTKLKLDLAGNLGLGVTPSAWNSGTKAIDINTKGAITSGSGSDIILWGNSLYNTSSQLVYKTSAAASYYEQYIGNHIWYNAPSGTAGNVISFTQAMTLDASGRLGIGTTSPNTSLEVLKTSGSSVIRANYNNTTTLDLTASSSGNVFLETGNNAMILATNSTERMRITSGGNVGIGTTLPTSKLQIESTSAGAATVGLFLNNNSVTTSTEIRLAFAANTNTDISSNRYSYISALNTSGSNGQALLFATNEAGNSAVERMRITSGGNVGIGTTSPSGKLNVSGISSGISVRMDHTASYSAFLAYINGTDMIGVDNLSGAMALYAGSSERMRITSSGEILVNTTTDAGAYYLQVNGDVYANGYYESSDRRLKDILSVREGSYGINTVTFKWKDQRDSLTHVGYLAQDVEKVLPDAVKNNPNGYKTINYDEVQSFKIAALEQEVAELKEMIKKLLK